MKSFLWILLLILVLCFTTSCMGFDSPPGLFQENDPTPVQQIALACLENTQAYERIEEIGDAYGSRFSGTKALEDAINHVHQYMLDDNLSNVQLESVMVPHWVRGEENLTLIEPRTTKLDVLGLGGSIGTPEGGIAAQVLVVNSFDQLKERAADAVGKIVVYNVPFTTYSGTSKYRRQGAIEAAKVGAVASLTRSVTDHSLYTVHTGSMNYEEGVSKIPAASITVEDAEMFQRFQDHGKEIKINLFMGAKTYPDVESHNVIGELEGSDLAQEIIVVGGHIDSWDVGTGSTDDLGGCMIALESLNILKALGLQPRRTIRAVMFTNEENGARGGAQYAKDHAKELNQTVFALESDTGVNMPYGYSFQGNVAAIPTLQAFADELAPLLDLQVSVGGAGTDISPIVNQGVPGVGLQSHGFVTDTMENVYFDVHHTKADTFDKLNLQDVQLSLAAVASMVYQVANMEENLPRLPPVEENTISKKSLSEPHILQ